MREENSIQRLLLLNHFYNEIEAQRVPEIYHSLVIFHSILPEYLLRLITGYNMGASIGITNLMGPSDTVYFGGQKVCQKYAFSGLQWKHASMMLALFSYNGQITITLVANASVIPNQESVETVLEYLLDELTLPSHLEDESQNAGDW
ncbi:unnamed protein product [Orchesella dallaii]|uniref:O-acyltransferase WSD1 C-terminal domain-containing protein n=1 Tax=Orchesella dallaii TaxID=48710 RepID=A0ABP1QJ21_9HEXA